jgi:hypothetical protein
MMTMKMTYATELDEKIDELRNFCSLNKRDQLYMDVINGLRMRFSQPLETQIDERSAEILKLKIDLEFEKRFSERILTYLIKGNQWPS